MADTSRDELLIARGDPGWPGAFLLAACVAAALLTLAWWLCAEPFIRFKQPLALTTSEYNQADLVREMRKRPEVAIAGSSLAKQLRSEYFGSGRVGNVAVSGGSVLTGLQAVRAMTHPPRLVLAEINVLDRPVDAELAREARFADLPLGATILAGLTHPLRHLLTRPFGEHHTQQAVDEYWGAARARLLASPPQDHDTQATVTRGAQLWYRRMVGNAATLQRTVGQLRTLAADLERRGTRVVFVYLPMDPRYDAHPYARTARELVAGNPDFRCAACLDARSLVPAGTLRWEDGAHLDARSSAALALALEQWIARLPPPAQTANGPGAPR